MFILLRLYLPLPRGVYPRATTNIPEKKEMPYEQPYRQKV
jgi:hypothetical protein